MRKADLPFPCGDCNKTFPSVAAREMHRKAKHKVKVHSFEELRQVISKQPVPKNMLSGSRRWRVTGGKGWTVIAASLLFAAVLGLAVVSAWLASLA